MKRVALCVILFVLFSSTTSAQEAGTLDEAFSAAAAARALHWKPGEYDKALAAMEKLRKIYLAADSAEQRNHVRGFETLLCDLARASSLLNQPGSAVTCLKEYFDLAYASYSTNYREVGYYLLSRDPDFDNIRSDPGFRALLARFRAVGWQAILEEYGSYQSIDAKLIPFVYVDAGWEGLPQLREKYELDSIAGEGDDVSRIVNLMEWVHETIRHDGDSGEPEDRHADALIELSRKENRGLNCWMLATVLNEVYLATGFQSRIVSCYPKGDPSITHE